MYRCFAYAPQGALRSPGSVTGVRHDLHIFASDDGGPFYPDVVAETSDAAFTFFAGRLAGAAASARSLFASSDCTDWTFQHGSDDGSWLGLRFDRRTDTVAIASDRGLLQRWYYTNSDGNWYFANSLLFLRTILGAGLALNEQAAPYILLFGYLPGKLTPLRDVYSLRSGELLTVQSSHWHLSRRTSFPLSNLALREDGGAPSPTETTAAAQTALDAIRRAVSRECEGLSHAVIPISGGMDSRFVLACALDVLPRERITTFTWGNPRAFDYQIGAGLARLLGVRHVPLPDNREPLDRMLPQSFAQTEGFVKTLSNIPLLATRNIFPEGSHVLSGYLGETVWGARDKVIADGPGWESRLWESVLKRAFEVPIAVATELLGSENWDTLGLREAVLSAPAATPSEKYTYWHYDSHQINRVPFVLQIHRDRLFYLAPHVHTEAIRAAYAMPRSLRQRERGYFEAFRTGYPDLYSFPTARNYGFPLGRSVKWRPRCLRRLWRSQEVLDELLLRVTGRFYFHTPTLQYAHPLELYRPQHREIVLGCLDSLLDAQLLQRGPLRRVRDNFAARRIVPPLLVKNLITLQQWVEHYHGPSPRSSNGNP